MKTKCSSAVFNLILRNTALLYCTSGRSRKKGKKVGPEPKINNLGSAILDAAAPAVFRRRLRLFSGHCTVQEVAKSFNKILHIFDRRRVGFEGRSTCVE